MPTLRAIFDPIWLFAFGSLFLLSVTKAETSELKTSKQKTSYALGADLGNSLRTRSIAIDPEVFSQGLRDGLGGAKIRLTEAEIRTAIQALQNEQRAKDLEKQKQDGEAYLAGNKTKEGVVTLASGLQYKVLNAGTGKKPTATDVVTCHYRSSMINGTEFANSYKMKQPAKFAIDRAVDGWAEALQLMPVGSKWQLLIPPHLLRPKVETPGGSVPNAPLLFEVELLSIDEKK